MKQRYLHCNRSMSSRTGTPLLQADHCTCLGIDQRMRRPASDSLPLVSIHDRSCDACNLASLKACHMIMSVGFRILVWRRRGAGRSTHYQCPETQWTRPQAQQPSRQQHRILDDQRRLCTQFAPCPCPPVFASTGDRCWDRPPIQIARH